MLFNSYVFGIFFVAFSACYWLLRKHLRAQNTLILLASWIFYGWWDERFLVLIIVSIATDFLCGWGAAGYRNGPTQIVKSFAFLWSSCLVVVWISGVESAWILRWLVLYTAAMIAAIVIFERLRESVRRKAYVWASVVGNLGILGVFKYFNFFADQLQQAAASVGWEMSPITLSVILPVGISFYTFQTLSYAIDAYRGDLKPTPRLIEFAAFVSFFPQLVAGPIERAHNLLPQFFKPRTLNMEGFSSGIWLFLWGLFKKVVIADNLAAVADVVFGDPSAHGATDLLAGLLAFTFQIYCDFSGYSDMARGTARLLGFELMINFNLPYMARTPSEFWQRWHISLSSWLRDYLYIPLGGNRLGPFGVYRNLALTMLLGGLWHGANWTFVAWGAYHGAILIAYRALSVDRWLATSSGSRLTDGVRNLVAILVMFQFTLFGWLLFRARSLQDVGAFLAGMVDFRPGDSSLWVAILPLIAALLLVQAMQIWRKQLEVFYLTTGVAGLTVKALMVYGIIFLAARNNQKFIYFDF